VDLGSLHKILKHPIRRKIVLVLREKQKLSYVDLMNLVEIENTGKFNYHLKILGDLIMKNEEGKYRLTEKGDLASQLLLKFPEKTFKPIPLRGGDAILIGSVGFLLALLNPGYWALTLLGIGFLGVSFLGLAYALMTPGGVMWLLTVKRTNSNDLYDLFKPPLVTSALFVLMVVVMALLGMKLPFTNSDQPFVPFMPLPTFITSSVVFSFLGIVISEVIYRAKTQGMLNVRLRRFS
jgi:hypothetical protein